MKDTNNPFEENISAEAYLHEGDTLFNQGDYESAILEYNRALELNPDHAEALLQTRECQIKIERILSCYL